MPRHPPHRSPCSLPRCRHHGTHPADNETAAFIGIIYDHVGDTGAGPSLAERCQFSETIPATKPDRRAYLGPCRTGWVARRFVEILAD
jgi:hypothetical protein